MNAPKLKMNLGAEPKKVIVLAGLLGLAGYLFFANFSEDTRPASQTAQPVTRTFPVRGGGPEAAAAPAPSGTAAREFRPSLAPRKGEDRTQLDPTLRLDLLARLEAVRIDRVSRSLFDFGLVDAPKPKLPEPKIVVKPAARMIGPEPPPPPPAPAVKPPPPPIDLKFYGAALPVRGNGKRVFCLRGDDILTPAEGDVILNRYKILRISAASVLVEDMQYQHRQQIPIDQPPSGS